MSHTDCVANTTGTIAVIRVWIKGLYQNIHISVRDDLKRIEELFKTGVKEILSEEGLSQETCLAMSALLQGQEEYAFGKIQEDPQKEWIYYYEGLKRIHDKMTLLIPEGMNEGQKPCCPFCDDC